MLVAIFVLLFLIAIIYASLHKKSIIQEVTKEIGKKINGQVSIGDVELNFLKNFPKTSVILHSVRVTDSIFSKHHHVFFQADDVYIELNIWKLIQKKTSIIGIKIEKGSMDIFTAADGYTNAYLLKPKEVGSTGEKSSGTGEKNNLKNIELKDVRLIIDDRKNGKLNDFVANSLKVKIDDETTYTAFTAWENILVHNFLGDESSGSFLKEKNIEGGFSFRYVKNLKQLQFDNISINLSGHPFKVSGTFDLSGQDPQFSLTLHTRQVVYSLAKSFLPQKTENALSVISIDSKIDADATISGPLRKGNAKIGVTWKVSNANLTTPFLNFTNAFFTGYYTNHAIPGQQSGDANSKVVFTNFSANWHGMPVTSGSIEIQNLSKPLLICDLSSNFPLTGLNEIIATNSLQFQSGEGSINVTYRGPLEKNTNSNSFINGFVSLKKGSLNYIPRNVLLKDLEGRLAIDNSDVNIDNLQFDLLGNKLQLNGQAKNLITLINSEPNNAIIECNINSPSINLSSFIYLLKERKNTNNETAHKSAAKPISSGIDAVLENGRLNINLNATRLYYKTFEASNVNANVTLLPDNYTVNNVSMDHAGGHINLNGTVVLKKANDHLATINATINNVDVNKIFEAFNNFGQKGIEAKNLEGKLDANASATLELDNNAKAYPSSVSGTVDFELKNGALLNFVPIEKIQSFIFKNRDFNNIRFADLKDRLEIANQEIKINRMEIESTVLSMYVEGVYSLKGNSDLSIQLPLTNLKRREGNYNPENIGLDKNAGPSLYIRGRTGPDGNIQFKPDFFNKFKKEKLANQ